MKTKLFPKFLAFSMLIVPQICSANNGISALGEAYAKLIAIAVFAPLLIAGVATAFTQKRKRATFGYTLLFCYVLIGIFILQIR